MFFLPIRNKIDKIMISLSRNINNVSVNRTEEQFRLKTCALPVNSSEFVCHADRTFMKGPFIPCTYGDNLLITFKSRSKIHSLNLI